MLTTSQLRKAWGPPCRPASWRVTIALHGDGRITVDTRTQAAFAALNACLRAHGYRTRRSDTGAYNCRRITGGTGYSLHAYGIAADLNWQTNPYSKRLITDMPPAMVAAIKAIRTRNGRQVFGWGGDYRTNKDAMHFEVVCTPGDLATGIDPRTVPGQEPAAPPKPADPNAGRPWQQFKAPTTGALIWKKGGRNDEVTELLILLRDLGFYRGDIVDTYSGAAVSAVQAYKRAANWRDSKGRPDTSSVVSPVLVETLRVYAAMKSGK